MAQSNSNSNSSELTSKGTVRIWPFRHPLTYADASVFGATMLAAIIGFVASLVEQSWAFAAISFVLGTLAFQEMWTRIERLSKIEERQTSIEGKVGQASESARQAVEKGFEGAVKQIGAVKVFHSREETYDYISTQLTELKPKRIDIVDRYVEWPPPLGFDHPRHRAQDDLLRKGTTHRRVAKISTPEDWQAAQSMMEHWKEVPFYLGCILEELGQVPIVSCMIMDDREAYFGQGFLGNIQMGSVMLAHGGGASLFYDYFQFLWGHSLIVKGERGLDKKAFAEVERWLTTKAQAENAPRAVAYWQRDKSYESMLGALDGAKESIDIVSFVNLTAAESRRLRYYTTLRRALEERHVSHQRIIWNLDHVLWLEQMLDDGWDGLAEFTVKYYRQSPSSIPLTTFDLIDQRMVIFGQGWLTEGHVIIDDSDVGRYFRSYFATLWEPGEWIKHRAQPANRARLRELAKELANG